MTCQKLINVSVVLCLTEVYKEAALVVSAVICAVCRTVLCLKAEDFEKKAHGMLDWLTEAEHHLRYHGAMPDNEEVLEQQLAEHQVPSCHSAATL